MTYKKLTYACLTFILIFISLAYRDMTEKDQNRKDERAEREFEESMENAVKVGNARRGARIAAEAAAAQAQFDSDVTAIKQLLRDTSDAYANSFADGVAFSAAHNWPELQAYKLKHCPINSSSIALGNKYHVRFEFLLDSAPEKDQDWILRTNGMTIKPGETGARVYIARVTNFSSHDLKTAESSSAEIHFAVKDGDRVYTFNGTCS